ncbi:hypothetical protein [Pseudomonas syringae group sp. J309-1]|uniref:hypothetical protein n=1 Tax=Pseudomonas syringae group sp. J309-1 TaxID=3079588 RepID=UPI0029062357|nr:hypothetical protein [Pseudomonas syringae group sp. J309-1]MDU8362606.1 hypothetical protein [Pseudomonas syringae group sp. J309-1]
MKARQSINNQPAQGPLPGVEVPFVSEDGKLPHDQWDQDLRVSVLNHDSFTDGTIIWLTLNSVVYGTSRTVESGHVGDPSIRYTFEVSKDDFPSGNPQVETAINYKVQYPGTEGTSSSPFTYTLIFDKQPPGGNPLAYINFTPEQLQGIYPDDIIEGNLRTILPPWSGMALGDKLIPWLGNAAPDESNATEGLIPQAEIDIEQGDVGRPVGVLFPQSHLEALGDIPQHFGYQLRDVMGNASAISPTREIPVYLQVPDIKRPSSGGKALPVPRVTRQNPALDPLSITGTRPSDGRLPKAMLGVPIAVTIPLPPTPRLNMTAQLLLNGFELTDAIGSPVPMSDSVPTIIEIAVGDQPDLTPADYHGLIWRLDYWLRDNNSGSAGPSYKQVPLIFDGFAPGGIPPVPGAISFTPEQMEGITEDDMDGTAGGLKVHMSSWYGEDYDDQVELWLGDGPALADGSYIVPLPPKVTAPGSGLDVLFPRALLEAFPPGEVFFGYRVTDWAGHVSELSYTTGINVFLNGLPEALLAPLIPEAAPYNPADGTGLPAGAGLLIWNEANPTTRIDIPTYTNVAENDRVYIKWNTLTNIPPVPVLQTDIDNAVTNGYLLRIELQFKEYVFLDAGGDNIGVGYEVHAANGTPPVPSPLQYINVDLETPGGIVDPDPDKPEHPNMRGPQLLSDFAGSQPNIITAPAFASPAKLTVFRAGAINSALPIWKLGDVISFYWGADHTDDPVDVDIDASNETTDIVIPIPATMIRDNGPGSAIPLYYVITRELRPGHFVTAQSLVTLLQVTSPDALPGGPNDLVAAYFPQAVSGGTYKVIQHDVGHAGTTLQIPTRGVLHVQKGDFISVDFVGVLSMTDPTAAPIEASRITVTAHPIDADDDARGYFEVPLPYSKTYFICENLSTTNYRIRNSAGEKAALQEVIFWALYEAGLGCKLP